MTARPKPERAYLHTYSWAGYFATPCLVMSRGKRYATVKLLHGCHIGRTRFPAGTVKRRVPNESVTTNPAALAYVSQGRGVYR